MRPIFVRPNPDKQVDGKPLQVMDPVRRRWLKPEGETVQETPYWLRRLAERDVVQGRGDEGAAPAKPAPAKPAPAKPAVKKKTTTKKPATPAPAEGAADADANAGADRTENLEG